MLGAEGTALFNIGISLNILRNGTGPTTIMDTLRDYIIFKIFGQIKFWTKGVPKTKLSEFCISILSCLKANRIFADS